MNISRAISHIKMQLGLNTITLPFKDEITGQPTPSENVRTILIGTRNKYLIQDPLFKISRKSISEGIFESLLATTANADMENGNTYLLYNSKYQMMNYNNHTPVYIHCDGEYMYIGLNLISSDFERR